MPERQQVASGMWLKESTSGGDYQPDWIQTLGVPIEMPFEYPYGYGYGWMR